MRTLGLVIDELKLGAFCRRHGVVELALFGSALREDFRAGSDVDVLVRFTPPITLTLDSYADMTEELSELFGGREVDLVEEGRLVDPYRRAEILRTREIVYAG